MRRGKEENSLKWGLRTVAALVLTNVMLFAASPSKEISKAEDLYQHTDFENSLALLDKHSEDAGTNFLAGRDYFSLGDFKKAVDSLGRAVAKDPLNSGLCRLAGSLVRPPSRDFKPFDGPRIRLESAKVVRAGRATESQQ